MSDKHHNSIWKIISIMLSIFLIIISALIFPLSNKTTEIKAEQIDIGNRVTALEQNYQNIKEDLNEIKTDIKEVLKK